MKFIPIIFIDLISLSDAVLNVLFVVCSGSGIVSVFRNCSSWSSCPGTEGHHLCPTEPFSMQLSQLSGGVAPPASGAAAAAAVGGTGTVTGGAVGMTNKPLPLNQRLQLQREPWFHGAISRKEAEMLLRQVCWGTCGMWDMVGERRQVHYSCLCWSLQKQIRIIYESLEVSFVFCS